MITNTPVVPGSGNHDVTVIGGDVSYCPFTSLDFLLRLYVRSESRQMPFFALVMGINAYQKVVKLNGAMADADRINDLLQDHLKVPEGNIINLRNKEATREGIIEAFRKL
jgi:hypothetical protein